MGFPLGILPEADRKIILDRWREMNSTDKKHFTDQVALALTVWGCDENGKRLVIEVLRRMIYAGCKTLADFGLFVGDLSFPDGRMRETINTAAMVLEGYRFRSGLSSVPHIEAGF